ncbi:MAG: hypothetical protein IKO46_01115 [Salinivirgaceae bacterium]|nr:hypothetical protein [Salinivirgaceae bacterium]MBR4619559.1 hypothetical protein [Salinivirgaceae bacterium]MBR5167451.1 hypothetical protein [Salinivirgaceae bacterium]
MKKLISVLSVAALCLAVNFGAQAQCKTFIKNECKPKLSPYIYNGQMNSAVLNQGDFAELMLTFYSNQDYRIVVCSDGLGDVTFRLLDLQGKELFTNADHNYTDTWDFSTNSTQLLTVEVSVPENTTDEEPKSGCVSILVGFKEK